MSIFQKVITENSVIFLKFLTWNLKFRAKIRKSCYTFTNLLTEWTIKMWSDKIYSTCRSISAIEILKLWQYFFVFLRHFGMSLRTFYHISDNAFLDQMSLFISYKSFVLIVIYKGMPLLGMFLIKSSIRRIF